MAREVGEMVKKLQSLSAKCNIPSDRLGLRRGGRT